MMFGQVDESVYAVCDSSWAISKFSDNLQPFGPGNVQIGQPDRETEVRSSSGMDTPPPDVISHK